VEGEVLLKISILIYSLGSGGAEKQVSILLKELSKKYEVQLVLMNDTIFYEVPKNVKIKYLEKSNPKESGLVKLLKLPILALKYKKLLKGFDVSISFMNRPNYINVLAKLFGSKTKVVVSERSMPSLYKNFQGLINGVLIKILYNLADVVVSNSKGNSYDLEKNFGIKKVRTIYNFIENKECKRKNLKDFVFINIGRMDEGKNQKLLIYAFKKANLNAQLWLIGDGPLKNKLKKLVKELALEDKVLFLGVKKDIYKYLAKANCFVFSSNYEGFPNVLLEALDCGLPVISTDCKSGPREILAPMKDFKIQTDFMEILEYGILTKVGDVDSLAEAMKIIYKDEKLRYNLEVKAKKRAKDFRVDRIIKQWEEILIKR